MQFFRHLILYWDRRNVKFEQWGALHLIGHSLGAHVAGQASKMLRRFENVTVDRITGLDPAEPCFEVPGFPLRLSKTDARFVDIIHTDSATSINQAFGLRDPIGHADFYVNGGVRQPGCEPKTKLQDFLDYTQLINHILANGQCSHNRAFTLFIESVQQATLGNQCVFYAYPWRLNSSYKETKELISKPCTRQTCSEMGINAEFYEFKTNIHCGHPTNMLNQHIEGLQQ
ncbi:pancreatic triacylglycerol lipase-like [Trichogramma pretiosum]|uniref:pancreatic triacylglycerol lipase-like n=1 Tax=Trichogramma pretiosum TaxID=7493 RepID=UPI0006C9612A|nr:pancreatic triacylglycerol lipase-like [Trichogramma pretiosum]